MLFTASSVTPWSTTLIAKLIFSCFVKKPRNFWIPNVRYRVNGSPSLALSCMNILVYTCFIIRLILPFILLLMFVTHLLITCQTLQSLAVTITKNLHFPTKQLLTNRSHFDIPSYYIINISLEWFSFSPVLRICKVPRSVLSQSTGY